VLGNKVLADDEPLANLNRRASVSNKRTSIDQTRPDDTAVKGLLSKTYSQRQRDGVGKENHGQQHDRGHDDTRRQSMDLPQRGKSTRTRPEPRTDGSGGDLRRNKSTRNPAGSGPTSGDLGRSASTRAKEFMPKPLVDLSPQYEEPPQHIKKGRGHIPDQVGAGGLIEAATSPEDPIGAPPATDWRGRNAQTSSPGLHAPQQQQQQARARSNDRRDQSQQQPQQRPPTSTSRSPHDEHGPFTGEGLMAGSHAHSGWGGGELGRGVVTEAGRGKPLLDMKEPSKFVKGSLLNRIERVDREAGRQGPVVERGEEG